jgi:hypothetical protein
MAHTLLSNVLPLLFYPFDIPAAPRRSTLTRNKNSHGKPAQLRALIYDIERQYGTAPLLT